MPASFCCSTGKEYKLCPKLYGESPRRRSENSSENISASHKCRLLVLPPQ